MERQFMSIPVEYTLDDIFDLNDDLARGTLRVAYTGKNRNGSDIGRTAFEKAVPTLAYKPVVAHLIEEKKDFGGHDGEVQETDDGDVVYVNVTEPVGVVPERTPWNFEVVTEESGVHNYFTIDVILWKRQRSFDVIKQKKFTKQSMEIEVIEGYSDSGGYHIEDFKFLAFCLLGDDVEPCFEGSRLELFTVDKVKEEFDLFLDTLRNYNETQLPLADEHIENQRKEESGTVNKIEEFTKIGLDPESLGLDLETMSDEDVTAKVFELTSNLMEQIRDCLAEQTFDTEWGKIQRYWLVETDLEAKMLYCYDEEDGKLYGIPYSLSGDAVTVDWDSRKRMKFAIVEFQGGEEAPVIGFAKDMAAAHESGVCAKYTDLLSDMNIVTAEKADLETKLADANVSVENYKADNETLTAKVGELSGEIENLNSTIAELEQFKAGVEAAEVFAEKENLFAKWESLLSGTESFAALKSDMDNFSVEELETQLKCLFADTKANFELKSPVEKKPNRVAINNEKRDSDAGDYGGLYKKHGIKPIRE